MPPTDEALVTSEVPATEVAAVDQDAESSSTANETETAAAATSEAEPAKEETPEEKAARELAERKAARIKAAEEAELEAAEARQEKKWRQQAAAHEAAIAQERAHLQAVAKQLEQQAQQNQRFAEMIERVRRGEASPDEALGLVGTNYEQMTRDWLSRQTPEGIAKAALAEAQAAKKLLAERDQAEQQRQAAQVSAQDRAHFASWVDQNDDKFPHLADVDPEEVGVAAERLARAGVTSYNEIARRLEEQAKAIHDRNEQRRQVRLARRQQPSNGTTPEQTQAPPGNGAHAKQPGPRALPSALATQKVTPNTKQMTDEELDEHLRQEFRKAREIDRRNAEKS